MPQDIESHSLESRLQRDRARDSTRMQQGLMLPSPRFAALIFSECVYLGDEHAPLAARSQSYIHFVQAACSRVHRQDMHDALGETHKENLVVDGSITHRLLFESGGIVQKDEI